MGDNFMHIFTPHQLLGERLLKVLNFLLGLRRSVQERLKKTGSQSFVRGRELLIRSSGSLTKLSKCWVLLYLSSVMGSQKEDVGHLRIS